MPKKLRLRDPQIVAYVAHLLSEFCEAEELFKIRNANNAPVDGRWGNAD